MLHLKYLGALQCFDFADTKHIFELWTVDFLVFHCNQKTGDRDKLQLSSLNFLHRQILIDQKNDHVESLCFKVETSVNVSDPFDQASPHGSLDVSLDVLKVGRGDALTVFFSPHVLIQILGIL